jgi:hypothetical protein
MKNDDRDGTRLKMAATTAKPTFMVRWTLKENERNLRKLFFAAAVDIPDQTLSNLAQPLVRIALKLLGRASRLSQTIAISVSRLTRRGRCVFFCGC